MKLGIPSKDTILRYILLLVLLPAIIAFSVSIATALSFYTAYIGTAGAFRAFAFAVFVSEKMA